MILAPVPEDLEAAPSIDLAGLPGIAVDRRDGPRRHMVLTDREGDQYLWLTGSDSHRGLAVILPFDATFDTRIEAVIRFSRRLRGRPAGPPPRALDLTPQRRSRLIQLLHTLDFRLAGASPREIAAALLDAEVAALPAVEWKSSATRRKVNRLITDALALMNGGYRKLLRGG